MADVTTDILTIVIKSNYYKNNISKDFEIFPDKKTESFLKQHSMSIATTNISYKIIWLTKNINDIKTCFKTIFSDYILKFDIFIKNKKSYKFLDVRSDVLYLYENNKDSNNLKVDTLLKFDYDAVLPEGSFGKISLDLSNLNIDNNNEFVINIDSLNSYWNIKINKNKTSIHNILGIFINGNKYEFFKIEKNSFIYYISKENIPLHESGFYKLTIEYLTNRNTVEVDNLVAPTNYNKLDKGNYISDIICNF